MSTYVTEEGGWPYPDTSLTRRPNGTEPTDDIQSLADEPFDPYDDDAVALHAFAPHLLDDLDPLERSVVAARFGLGVPVRSMKDLHQELHLPREQLREALGSGLAKIRKHLIDG